MIGEDFHYNNFWLSDYGMRMYASENTVQFVGREIDKSDLTSIRKTPNHYSVHYSDTKTLSFLILKDTCSYSYQKEYKLTGKEINTLRSWLESPKTPIPLYVLPSDDTGINVYYYGVFTDIQPFLVNQVCYGLYLTFTCNAPYGFSEAIINTYKINSLVGDIYGNFYSASTEQCDYIYPIIRIYSSSVFNGTEKISLKNISDNNSSMNLTMPKGVSILNIDCKNQSILDENGDLILLRNVRSDIPDKSEYSFLSVYPLYFYWIRFLHGENKLCISTLNENTISKIEIESRFAIKSGGF